MRPVSITEKVSQKPLGSEWRAQSRAPGRCSPPPPPAPGVSGPSGNVPRSASPGYQGAQARAGNHGNPRTPAPGGPAIPPPREAPGRPPTPSGSFPLGPPGRGRARSACATGPAPSPRPDTHRLPPAPQTGDTASGTTTSCPLPARAAQSWRTPRAPHLSCSWCHRQAQLTALTKGSVAGRVRAGALPSGRGSILA